MNRQIAACAGPLIALALAACGGDDVADSPLAHVPADTPYVFASLEPMPEAAVDKWSEAMAPVRDAYAESLARARAELERSEVDPVERARILSLMDLFEDKLTLKGWEDIGFSRGARAAIYGVGALPVMRLELGDPDRLRAFVAEFEQRMGQPLPVAEVDGLSYWRFAPAEDKPMALVVAIIDQHLVLALDAGPDVVPLPQLLGLVAPARSMADSGELQALNKAMGFGPWGTLLLDSGRLATALFGSEGQDTWLTRLMAEEGKPVTPACRSEFAAMAGIMPRMVSGYSRFDANMIDSMSRIELRSDLAEGLMPIAAPVPGLGHHDTRAHVDVGFGVRLDKLAEFMQARAAAIRATPYQCEHLAALNEGADNVSQQAAGLYMAAGWFTGMRAVLTDFDWPAKAEQPKRVEGTWLMASPNPGGLVGMLRGFVPQLADLNLVAGAEPQPLALGELAGEMADQVPPTWVAMSDSAIGLGFGQGGADILKTHLSASSPAQPPLLYIAYDGEFYARLMKQFNDATQARAGSDIAIAMPDIDLDVYNQGDNGSAVGAGVVVGGADGGIATAAGRDRSETMQHIFEPMGEAMNALYAIIDYTSTSVVITERGIELRQIVHLDP